MTTRNKQIAQCTKKSRERKRDIGPSLVKSKPKSHMDFEKPAKDDALGWLKTYMDDAFPSPFGIVHHEINEGFEYALKTGGNVEVLAPRGTGKSTEVNGLTLRAVLEGLTPFPVVVAWDAKAVKRALRFWKTHLCFNPRIHRDYPEATAIFRESRGIGQRLSTMTEGQQATGAMLAISEGIIVFPNGLGAIGSTTINGNPRGIFYTNINLEQVRPSLAIVDDPQDREVATSPMLVAQTMETIDGDVAGMAGPNCRMPIIMNATVIARDDVPEQYAKRPGWRVIRTGQVLTWPDGWEDERGACRKLWAEWNDIRMVDGDTAAVAFYMANKRELTQGMTVSWASRFDANRGQPDALYGAMVDYHVMGFEAFAAERQNCPIVKGVDVYSLSPDIIMSRTVDRAPFEVPQWAEIVLCASDINPSYAISTVVYAYGKDATKACLWYGKFEDAPLPTSMDMSDQQKEQIIFGALWKHGEQLLRYPRHGKQWAIDGGGAQTTVAKRFSYEWNLKHPEMRVIVMYGRAGKTARVSAKNETIRRRGIDGSWLHCRDKDPTYGWTEWVLWNADYWREIMQRSWTCETNAPGCSTLPKGSHREYAEHLCREKLRGKVELNGRMIFDFEKAPGRNDFSDATGMCHVLADMNGIGTGGEVKQQQKAAYFVSSRK